MAIHNPPPKTPTPQGENLGKDAIKLAQQYMFRQYWSMKWLLLTVIGVMSTYTINAAHWIPGIGLTSLYPFIVVFLGTVAGVAILNTEFLKAIRAKQLDEGFDWTKARYAAWGCVLANVIMAYWFIVMGYLAWFADDPTKTFIQ